MCEKAYDRLILDWMLPRISGLALCQSYRAAGEPAPILMITVGYTTADEVFGLDAAADP
ncbi:MAG TPA: response regulator [Thermoleptolyngbya sp. M55_K2018_002]|nr:response regulator [Thermoleptolyngbya sp. M55_K2018_002]